MAEYRIENEIKLMCSGGPYKFSASDSAKAVSFLMNTATVAGMKPSEPQFCNVHDEYYVSKDKTFEEFGYILRYRIKDGWKHTVAVKMPYIRDGLGLSRREIETDLFVTNNFDRFEAVKDHARKHIGMESIEPVPKITDDILRMKMKIVSEVRSYNLTFDRIVYKDPISGKFTEPGFELEIESMDAAIKDDVSVNRFINMLTETGMFRDVRMSKYERGKRWVDSLNPQ